MPRTTVTKLVAIALAVASLGFAGMGHVLAGDAGQPARADEARPVQVDQAKAGQADPGERTGRRIVTTGIG